MAGCVRSAYPHRTLLGQVTDDEAVVRQCAHGLCIFCASKTPQMVTEKKSANDQPIVFGIKNGNECWIATDAATAKRGGEALQQCDSRPDRRGQAVGGVNAMSVYTMYPAGLLAQYIRIIRKAASLDVQPEPQTAFLHITGLSVDDGPSTIGRPWNIHDDAQRRASPMPVAIQSNRPPIPLTETLWNEGAADATLEASLRRHNDYTAGPPVRGVMQLGPEIDNYFVFDLGQQRRIQSRESDEDCHSPVLSKHPAAKSHWYQRSSRH